MKFDGMELELPQTWRMLGVYRSGVLLGIFSTKRDAEEYLGHWSKTSLLMSMRYIEDTGDQIRIVPLEVDVKADHTKGSSVRKKEPWELWT